MVQSWDQHKTKQIKWVGQIPHALQMGLPSSSRRQRGVFVVPQFWHCISVWEIAEEGFGPGAISGYWGVPFAPVFATMVAAAAA
jgi:hypothetical protein